MCVASSLSTTRAALTTVLARGRVNLQSNRKPAKSSPCRHSATRSASSLGSYVRRSLRGAVAITFRRTRGGSSPLTFPSDPACPPGRWGTMGSALPPNPNPPPRLPAHQLLTSLLTSCSGLLFGPPSDYCWNSWFWGHSLTGHLAFKARVCACSIQLFSKE